MPARKKQLHQPPHEFAVAAKMRRFMNIEEQRYRWEHRHNVSLPSHPKGKHPYLKHNELWNETYEEAKYRLSNRKAGKIFI